MVPLLILIAVFILLVFLCVKGIMWGASLMVLLRGALSCLVIALVILFALPKEAELVGPAIPYLPICISATILLSAVLSIVIAQKNTNVASGRHNKTGIAVLVLGVALWTIGFMSFCLFILGGLQGGPNPKAAVITFSTLTLAGSISLYFSTKYESVVFPNIYRWVLFWASNFMLTAIFVCSMIFLFAFPSSQPVSHPFWASINSLNYLPVAILFVALNKSYVKENLADAYQSIDHPE